MSTSLFFFSLTHFQIDGVSMFFWEEKAVYTFEWQQRSWQADIHRRLNVTVREREAGSLRILMNHSCWRQATGKSSTWFSRLLRFFVWQIFSGIDVKEKDMICFWCVKNSFSTFLFDIYSNGWGRKPFTFILDRSKMRHRWWISTVFPDRSKRCFCKGQRQSPAEHWKMRNDSLKWRYHSLEKNTTIFDRTVRSIIVAIRGISTIVIAMLVVRAVIVGRTRLAWLCPRCLSIDLSNQIEEDLSKRNAFTVHISLFVHALHGHWLGVWLMSRERCNRTNGPTIRLVACPRRVHLPDRSCCPRAQLEYQRQYLSLSWSDLWYRSDRWMSPAKWWNRRARNLDHSSCTSLASPWIVPERGRVDLIPLSLRHPSPTVPAVSRISNMHFTPSISTS